MSLNKAYNLVLDPEFASIAERLTAEEAAGADYLLRRIMEPVVREHERILAASEALAPTRWVR